MTIEKYATKLLVKIKSMDRKNIASLPSLLIGHMRHLICVYRQINFNKELLIWPSQTIKLYNVLVHV